MIQATNNIEDYSHSTRLLAATTLRWSFVLFSFPVQPFEQFIFGYYDPLQSFEKLIKVLGRIISAYVELIM